MNSNKLKILSVLGIIQALLGVALASLVIIQIKLMTSYLVVFAFFMVALHLINSGWVVYKKKKEGRIISFYNFITISLVLAVSMLIIGDLNIQFFVLGVILIFSATSVFYLK